VEEFRSCRIKDGNDLEIGNCSRAKARTRSTGGTQDTRLDFMQKTGI
jgi:hypothetical protein